MRLRGYCEGPGNLYVVAKLQGRVEVYDPSRKRIGQIDIKTPSGYEEKPGPTHNASNCVFGGPEGKTLFITGEGGVYAVRLKVAGRKPPAPSPVLARKSEAAARFRPRWSWPQLLLGRRF